MALELYHSPYRLTMYYQGLLSLIAPSQMMICGTLTLRYLFRIVLSGAVAKILSHRDRLLDRVDLAHLAHSLTPYQYQDSLLGASHQG